MDHPSEPAIDPARHRRVRRFFARVFFHVLIQDVVLNRPGLRLLRRPAPPRWAALARRYRVLATDMGGVLIKLGQFLSTRVDILPPEVTDALAGLQDEVPPAPAEAVVAAVAEDLGRPVDDLFAAFFRTPAGAASLAQVHRVRLPDGAEAVIKVLRPGIERIVETDLSAIRAAFSWLKLYRRVRERVDLDWLAAEFSTVTRAELDLRAEGRNIERFAADFADHSGVRVPAVHWAFSGRRTLTLENVAHIKIADLEALEAAGIRRSEVADRLHAIYMRQVFETHFVHVDPHPGNLFVRPLPTPEEREAGVDGFLPGDPVPSRPGRPFQLVLVDFGMAVEIPERLRFSIREYAIGVGTRDAGRIVQSLVSAGTLLRNADLRRLEEIHEAMFRRLWGTRVGQFRDLAVGEARFFLDEYRDVIYDAPFQFQADMLFVVRAIGILSGLAGRLDPAFDPWAKSVPYAERYARETLVGDWRQAGKELAQFGEAALSLPSQLDRLLRQAREGRSTVQAALTPETRTEIRRLEGSIRRLGWMVLSAGLIISWVVLRVSRPEDALGWGLLLAAGASFWMGGRGR